MNLLELMKFCMFSCVNIRKCSCFREVLFVFKYVFENKQIFSNIFYLYVYVFHMIIGYFLMICMIFISIFRKNVDFFFYILLKSLSFYLFFVIFLRDFMCIHIICCKILYVTCNYLHV